MLRRVWFPYSVKQVALLPVHVFCMCFIKYKTCWLQWCSLSCHKAWEFLYVYWVCFSIKAVYGELHHSLMSISEPDDLRWWKNNHGPGMPTDWPKLEVCVVMCILWGKLLNIYSYVKNTCNLVFHGSLSFKMTTGPIWFYFLIVGFVLLFFLCVLGAGMESSD